MVSAVRIHSARDDIFVKISSSSRFVHFVLPEDPHEAHRLLTSFSRTADQINPLKAEAYDKNRLHDVLAGGFSAHPWRNQAPAHGFMASYDDPNGQGFGQVHDVAQLKPEHIAAHRTAIQDNLRDKGAYQGGWLDQQAKKVYLDLSHHSNSEDATRKFALANRQKSYYNLGTGEEHFLDPKQDPVYLANQQQWAKKYKNIGTEAPPEYESYRYLYEPESG